MTNTDGIGTATVPTRGPRFNVHEEIAERIARHMMRYRSFSDPEDWRRFSVARIRAALDAPARRGR
jgi:hypothetical protein